ncbi:hypothetical protein MCHI_003873 [Candidatus Magnetoovum chiemensis]|nr:hypothetical protein MCHI_003873 [Candidatus Magnetoovum chiemensis]
MAKSTTAFSTSCGTLFLKIGFFFDISCNPSSPYSSYAFLKR